MALTDGVAGDPTLLASGSFTIPRRRNSALSNLTAAWLSPTSVDLTIMNGDTVFRSFVDPFYFLYNDGIGANGYYVDVGPSMQGGRLDALDDQFFLTVHDGVVGGDFSTLSFANGFYSTNTTPISAISSVPEPSTWALTLAGLAGVAFAALRRRNQGRKGCSA